MKTRIKTAVAVVAALLAVTLSGCGDDSATSSEESAGVQSRSQSVETETPEPLASEVEAESETPSEADAKFLAYVRDNLLPQTQIPDASDEELISAGHEACEQLDAGTAFEDVRVVDGEQAHENGAFYDTSAIMNGAIVAYCPKYL